MQFLLIRSRTPTDDVSDTRENVAKDVRSEDGLAGHDTVVSLYGLAVDSKGSVFVAQTDARNEVNGRSGTNVGAARLTLIKIS